MMTFIYTFLFLFLFGFINCSRLIGVCSKTKSAVSKNGVLYFKEKFCCDNFEKHEDGKCHACSIGFTSKARHACVPCLHDTFGFRCAENCQCDQKERCDNVHGCVPKHSDNLSTENSVTMINRTQHDLNNYQKTTFHMTTGVRPTRPNTELHSVIWTTQQSTKEDKTNGFIDQKVLIYMFMAVAVALVVIIGLCVCLICVCWRRQLSSKKKRIATSSSAVPLTKFPDIQDNVSDSQVTSGYGYELIDESKLERAIPAIQHEKFSVKSWNNNSEVCGTDSDGYLHPYHSLVSINNISSKGLNDQNNEILCDEKPYLELSAETPNDVQQNETLEPINNEPFNERDDEIMYDVPKDTSSNDEKVVFF